MFLFPASAAFGQRDPVRERMAVRAVASTTRFCPQLLELHRRRKLLPAETSWGEDFRRSRFGGVPGPIAGQVIAPEFFLPSIGPLIDLGDEPLHVIRGRSARIDLQELLKCAPRILALLLTEQRVPQNYVNAGLRFLQLD